MFRRKTENLLHQEHPLDLSLVNNESSSYESTMRYIIIAGLTLVAAYPILAIFVPFTDGSAEFSEIWLLDPRHTAADYPFNVSDGEMHNIFVCLGNHMGSSEYYTVYVRFGNSTQLDLNSSKLGSVPPLYEFRALVGDDGVWESPVTFGFQNVYIEDKFLIVDNVTMNVPIEDSVLSVDNVIINGIARYFKYCLINFLSHFNTFVKDSLINFPISFNTSIKKFHSFPWDKKFANNDPSTVPIAV